MTPGGSSTTLSTLLLAFLLLPLVPAMADRKYDATAKAFERLGSITTIMHVRTANAASQWSLKSSRSVVCTG